MKKILGSFLIPASLLFVTPVLAGGPHFSLEADSYGSTNDDGTYGRIIRLVDKDKPCLGTEVTFKFVEPKDGDYIMTPSGSASYTFTNDSPPYYQDGEALCGISAKMGSKVKGMRQVTVEIKDNNVEHPVINVDFDGEYHADNAYNGYNYWSSQDSPAYRLTHGQSSTPQTPTQTTPPTTTISNTINAWVLNQQLNSSNRQVTLKWGAFDGNPGRFSVLVKPAVVNKDWDKIAWSEQGPSVTVTIPNEDYYLKIYGCADKYGNCTGSNIISLPKIKIENGTVIVPSAVPVTSSTKIDELNKKVSDLQNQLDQTKKYQNTLDQKINDLINFIKKFFPFFK